MADTIDLLQIKIEEARRKLSEETRRAIDAVSWKATLIGLRESKGYSFEQLGDLEIETELLLCGLLAPEDYPKELEKRMNLPKAKVDELVNDMNQLVFSRMREELVKITERKRIFESQPLPESKVEEKAPTGILGINKEEIRVLDKAGIKIIPPAGTPALSTPEIKAPITHPILTQTEHTLDSSPKQTTPSVSAKKEEPKTSYPKGADPYRMPAE